LFSTLLQKPSGYAAPEVQIFFSFPLLSNSGNQERICSQKLEKKNWKD
jgi:hypothetical protein